MTEEEGQFPSSDDLHAWEVEQAMGGDRVAAIRLMRSAVAQLNTGNVRPGMAAYLARAFEAVLAAEGGPTGDAFERAFRVKRSRGERGSAATEKRLNLIAVWIHLAVARGWPDAEAKAQASDLWGYENIDRALSSLDEVEAKEAPGDETWERVFLGYGKPLLPRR